MCHKLVRGANRHQQSFNHISPSFLRFPQYSGHLSCFISLIRIKPQTAHFPNQKINYIEILLQIFHLKFLQNTHSLRIQIKNLIETSNQNFKSKNRILSWRNIRQIFQMQITLLTNHFLLLFEIILDALIVNQVLVHYRLQHAIHNLNTVRFFQSFLMFKKQRVVKPLQ